MIKAIFFDLDDTLRDRYGVLEECLQPVLKLALEHHPALSLTTLRESFRELEGRVLTPSGDIYTLQALFSDVLAQSGVEDARLAGEMAQLYEKGRAVTLRCLPEAQPVLEELKKLDIYPSFVVTGNVPLTIRESLLAEVFEMGEKVVERSFELFGGIIGPFCLETIVNDRLEFKVFEVSARIVAGTNPFISGSPYSDFISLNLSTGRRIAQEIKMAKESDKLDEILS